MYEELASVLNELRGKAEICGDWLELYDLAGGIELYVATLPRDTAPSIVSAVLRATRKSYNDGFEAGRAAVQKELKRSLGLMN